jgi:two-component system chemotaxis sensor kinase CheA
MSMNTSELLEQFTLEARDCLEVVGQRLLDLEHEPTNTEMINDLFRQVHTLKGNCGLFEFKPLERVVHAGEDLLDRVRNGRMAYTPELADALLNAMDYTAELVDAIAAHGELPAQANDRATVLAAALRALLEPNNSTATPNANHDASAAPATDATNSAATLDPLPDWAQDLPQTCHAHGLMALRYQPEAECFFKGEDPWHLALNIPGLVHLEVKGQQPWPAAAAFDCYACNLDIVAVSSSPKAYLEEHFRYVPEQVSWAEMHAAQEAAPISDDAATALLKQRVLQIWDEQRALLARPGLAAGTVVGTRMVVDRLLQLWGSESATLEGLHHLPGGAMPLATWMQAHHPAGAAASTGSGQVAPLEPRMGSGMGANMGSGMGSGMGTAGTSPSSDDAASGHRVLKVAQDKIDRLMDLIGEMVVAKNALPYVATRAETVFGQRELAREIKAQYAVINRIAEDMQHAIMQVRMMPVGSVFQRFGRLVRDLSKKLGKEVQLVVEGEDTEADKNVIEALADPLIHILRNSLDHGLELPAVRVAAGKPAQGTLRVSAHQEGDRVMLDIADDGAGIDTDRVRAKAVERGLIPEDRASSLSEQEAQQLIFLPGFSTADTISDLSGRGVGMDVVRSAVERINGTVTLESERGKGTTLRLALPLSMAVTNVMMIETGERRFGVPMDLIVETVRVPAEDIHHFKQSRTAVLRGRIVPLRAMNELLSVDVPQRLNEEGEHAVLVVRSGRENVGLIVDDFHGTSDIILKPLEGVLSGLTGFAGTALMGDGSVLMILNPKELL